MSNIEKIVADYETCKKAHEIGVIIKSVFSVWHNTWGNVFDVSINKNIVGIKYSAPTAEEVPLPKLISICSHNHELHIHFSSFERIFICYSEIIEAQYEKTYNNTNLATALLRYAIWFIENIPEAKQWYVANGFLMEDK